MKVEDERIETRLAELGRATSALSARAGYFERVMLAVHAETRTGWRNELVRSARRLVPIAAVAAAGALTWAVLSERSADEAFAAWDETVELEW